MIEYKYKKVTGYEQKKFTENGHTMFEEDVLRRLERLAYLEEQLSQANDKTTTEAKETTEEKALHIGSVSPRLLFDKGLSYVYELAKETDTELNLDTATMVAKDYAKHVSHYLSSNEG